MGAGERGVTRMKIAVMTAATALLLAPGIAAGQITVGAEIPAGQYPVINPIVVTRSVAVPYRDLDLTRTDGRTRLDRRLASAVDEVCGPRPLAVELRRQQNYSECERQAMAAAQQQVAPLFGPGAGAQAQAELRVGP
jgi:UrcA family protein